MIQWDATGTRGVMDHYEISVLQRGGSWVSVIWVRKTHITTLDALSSQDEAQLLSEEYLENLTKNTTRLMRRMKFHTDYDDGEDW